MSKDNPDELLVTGKLEGSNAQEKNQPGKRKRLEGFISIV